MTQNDQIYIEAFCEALEVTQEQTKDLLYESIPAWDSVGHMALMAALEERFDFVFEMDDIIDFSGFEKGKEILLKYGIKLS